MNELLILIADKGLAGDFRTLCIACGAVTATIFAFWHGGQLGLPRRKIIYALLWAYPAIFGLTELSFHVAKIFSDNHILGIETVVYSAVKTFVLVPVACYPIAKIVKIEWKELCDTFAVAHLGDYAMCTLGCVFTGCCVGYPFEHGLYSQHKGEYFFPTQIVNSLIMFLIIKLLLDRSKKMGYVSDGKQYPIMMIMFGSTRFITEYIMYNEKLIFGWSVISIHCIFMCIVGVVVLAIMKHKEKVAL